MRLTALPIAIVTAGLAIAGSLAAVGDASDPTAAGGYTTNPLYYGSAQQPDPDQQESSFVCGFSGAASWAPFSFAPTTIAFYGTNFCAGPMELERIGVHAFLHDAETDAVEAEAPLVAGEGTDATAVLSNGELADVERPRSFYIHVEVVTTLTEESGQIWRFAPAGCTGLGMPALTCSWDSPTFTL
jgi:hypothetical protein